MAWAAAGVLRAADGRQVNEDTACKLPSSAICPPSSSPSPVPSSRSSVPTPRRLSRGRP